MVEPLAERSVDVSVLIGVRNEERFIRESLRGMLAQRFDGEIEFILVDGASQDSTRVIAKEFERDDPRLRVLDNPKRTLRSGLNVGLAHAKGEFVVQMEGHSFYADDYVAQAVARLRRGDVEWVSGPPVPVGVDPGSRRVALALGSWLGTGGSRKWRREGHASSAETMTETQLDTGVFCGAWRRRTLERYGGWQEEWAVNGDAELAARILADGGRIVSLPQLSARYVPRSELSHLFRQYWRYGYFRAKTARAHPGSLRRSHVLPPALALAAVGAAVAKPSGLRGACRLLLAGYLTVSAVAAARAGAESAADSIALPAIYATMHLGWGLGFLGGCARFGPPLSALGRLARKR